jgi:hypothetical protein
MGEFHCKQLLSNKIGLIKSGMMIWGNGAHGERSTVYTVFNGKSEGNISLGKTSSKYEYNDKMDHNENNRTVWPIFICFWIWSSSGFLSTLMIGSQRDQEIPLFSRTSSPALKPNTPVLHYWRLLPRH